MTSHPPRQTADPSKQQWDHRRNRAATIPSHPYDPRPYPPHYNDPRPSSRAHPAYPPASKAYQHATRPSAQHPTSGYHYPQPSYQPAYHVAGSSRRQHTDAPDPRASRRPPPPAHQHPYDQVSSGEDMPRPSRHPSRVVHPSTQPPLQAPPNQAFWNPPREAPLRRHKDPYRDRERDQERDRDRDRERDRPTADLENRYKDRSRADRHRERERTTEVRYQEPSRSRHHDRRKDSDTEGVAYSDQRNASRTSLPGKEGHPVRESSNSYRRHRTEEATASIGRRYQSENTQNPITVMPSQPTSAPQPEMQQTGEPLSASFVMPVYLPPKAKSQRSHRDARPSVTQGVQPGSDTERAAAKYRMERAPSGPAVQRSDPHPPSITRDRSNHDTTTGPREDGKKPEVKYAAHQDARQPLAPINVDIPLVTPGFNASSLPTETKTSTIPQIVSIRAGQGPSDAHDAHFKSPAISHSDVPQETLIHPTSASIIKSPGHVRSQPFQPRAQSDRPVALDHPRAEPHGDDLPPVQRVSIHESSRALPTQISKSHSYTRGNSETGVEHAYPHSRPPSRSAHKVPANNAAPPAAVGPRPLRSVSQGPQSNEPPTRPPSQHAAAIQHSVPPSPVHPTQGMPPKIGHTYGTSLSTQPSPKNAHIRGVSLSYPAPAQQAASVSPSIHPTPVTTPRTLTPSPRPPTRDSAHVDAPHVLQQPADRLPTADDRLGPQQTPNGTTVKASWFVQTPATVKRTKISREDKYLRDQHFNLETPRAQLRQVLSQDDDSYPRVSSLMIKASQATTPSAPSQRNSPGLKVRDAPIGTPRGTLGSNSPRSVDVKEPPIPEHVLRHNSSSQFAGPPQIAVVGATPASINRELPPSRVDHALLVPPFPGPTLVSRTTSSPHDQPPRPPQLAIRDTSSSSSQLQPALATHAPSLFQPYRPPSLSSPEDVGQFSPPPLPIPPPRCPEDSPPPPVEIRTSEIIPARLQTDGALRSQVYSVPEVQSEMFHVPSLPLATSQPSSVTPPRAAQTLRPGKPDNPVQTSASNEPMTVSQTDARSAEPTYNQPDDVQATRQDITGTIPVLPSQSSVPARLRPKVVIEDVSEDSPVLSKAIPTNVPVMIPTPPRPQLSHQPTIVNASSPFKATVVDQPSHKSSPQPKNKDPPPHRGIDPSATPTPPSILPTSSTALPTSTRMPPSVPSTQPILVASAQAVPPRVTSHTLSSRTYQRAAEMLQASKLSPAATNSGVSGNVNKPSAASLLTDHSNIGGQHQLVNGVGAQGPPVSRFTNASTAVPHTSVTASTIRAAGYTTSGSGPPADALGLHISAPPTSTNIHLPSTSDPPRQQPSRLGTLSIPTLDTTSTSVMSTAKNVHQEQPVVDPARSRDAMSSATRHLAPSSHIYPSSTRPGTSSAMTQQTHVVPSQPSNHHRVVSLPITPSSTVAQRPHSPRKHSQPIPTVSTQPFPSRPSVSESQSARAATSGHVVATASVRSARFPPPDRMHDADMLKTPSSIAPSPMLNSDTPNALPQPALDPLRTRKPSTESKDEKKKSSGLLGLFRARTHSLKAADPPVVSTVTRTSLDQGRVQLNAPDVTPVAASLSRGVASTSAPREWNSATQPASASTRAVPEPRPKGRVPRPFPVPPTPTQAAREQKDSTPHIFTPFKFLTMHTKRNRTVSAASLDVCDGNTATNTVVGSPDHSAISQAQPLPRIIPPDIRDPIVATSEWRDREEAERRTHRIRRPGVTFDVVEEPPSPAPGAANKRKRLVRRPTGRAPTPGPPRAS